MTSHRLFFDKKGHYVVIGLSFIFSGIFFLVWTPAEIALYDRLFMRPGFLAYEWWKNPPDSTHLKMYVFNVTNHDRFLNGSDTELHLQEIGPFIFKEQMEHADVVFNGNGTMTYVKKTKPVYVPELNTIDLNTTIIVPNHSVMAIASYVMNRNFVFRMLFHTVYRATKPQLFVNTTIANLFWNFKDPFLTKAHELLPLLVPIDNAGLITRFTPDSERTVTVFMGPKSGHDKFFLIDKIDGSSQLPNYNQCINETLEGVTEGILYTQYLRKNSSVKLIYENSCKAFQFDYESETTLFGMDAFKFLLPNTTYQRTEPLEMDCFKGQPTLPNGFQDVSQCFYDAPVALSFPHFMNTDEKITSRFKGFEPDFKKHQSYVIIEPNTGVPLETKARMQASMMVRKLFGVDSSLKVFSDMALPMFWFEIDHVQTWYIAGTIFLLVRVLKNTQALLNVIVIGLGIFLIYLFIRKTKSRPKQTTLEAEKFIK